MLKNRKLLFLAGMVVVAGTLDTIVAFSMSPTTDEELHLQYGNRILHAMPDRVSDRIYDSQMPVSALNALPGAVDVFLEERGYFGLADILQGLHVARLPTVAVALFLDVFIFLWAEELFGFVAAVAAGILCTLSPSLIAHGTLATTDLYFAAGVVGALYFLRRFLLRPSLRNAVIAGAALAAAQTTKSFSISLYLVAAVALAAQFIHGNRLQSLTPRRVAAFGAIAAAWFVLTLSLVYSFDRMFTPLHAYDFHSALFTRLQTSRLTGQLPVPLPYPFLQGLDLMKDLEQSGKSVGNIYLLGVLRDSHDPSFHGFRSYYAVAWWFKEPIPLQILFICGLVWIVKNRRIHDMVRGEGLLLLASAILFVWLSFFNRDQIGIRHILPCLAAEIVIASAAFSGWASAGRGTKIFLTGMVVWLGISVATYYPAMIPYMNEWSPDRRQSFRLLADSNLDWGQDQSVVDKYLRLNPDVISDPEGPVAGRILVGANRLTGVDRWHSSARYLLGLQPVAQVGYAHFLFDVKPQDLERLRGAAER